MIKNLKIFLFLPALFWGGGACAAELSAEAGLYDISLQTELPGMPGMPAQKMRQCITQDDIKNPQNIMKRASQGDDCALSNLKQEGNTIRFSVACPKEKVSGQGEYRFAGDAYSGVMTMSMPGPGGQSMSMTVKTTAKRTGPCK
ncbi:MAG: DUF3617 family protein [Magnetococcales bacterium]|nr:DUF3617 family protein [Magnetococcales bacterium]